jgi:hypothetical protein
MKTIDNFINTRIITTDELDDETMHSIHYVVDWVKNYVPDRKHLYTYESLTKYSIGYSFVFKDDILINFSSISKRPFYYNSARIVNRFTNLFSEDQERSTKHGIRGLRPETLIIIARQIEFAKHYNVPYVFISREKDKARFKLSATAHALNLSNITNSFEWIMTDDKFQVSAGEETMIDKIYQYMVYANILDTDEIFGLLPRKYGDWDQMNQKMKSFKREEGSI